MLRLHSVQLAEERHEDALFVDEAQVAELVPVQDRVTWPQVQVLKRLAWLHDDVPVTTHRLTACLETKQRGPRAEERLQT